MVSLSFKKRGFGGRGHGFGNFGNFKICSCNYYLNFKYSRFKNKVNKSQLKAISKYKKQRNLVVKLKGTLMQI